MCTVGIIPMCMMYSSILVWRNISKIWKSVCDVFRCAHFGIWRVVLSCFNIRVVFKRGVSVCVCVCVHARVYS